jgi:hypothetical protein
MESESGNLKEYAVDKPLYEAKTAVEFEMLLSEAMDKNPPRVTVQAYPKFKSAENFKACNKAMKPYWDGQESLGAVMKKNSNLIDHFYIPSTDASLMARSIFGNSGITVLESNVEVVARMDKDKTEVAHSLVIGILNWGLLAQTGKTEYVSIIGAAGGAVSGKTTLELVLPKVKEAAFKNALTKSFRVFGRDLVAYKSMGSGSTLSLEVTKAKAYIENALTMEELQAAWTKLSPETQATTEVLKAKKAKKDELS